MVDFESSGWLKCFFVFVICVELDTCMRASLTTVLPGEPGITSFLVDFPSLYILFNSIPLCPSQTGDGTVVKEAEWRESTFCER